jgi:protein gp37
MPREILEAENVMIGVSVEDQARADERIPLLLRSWARRTFISCEPLLGEVRLDLDEGVWQTCLERGERLDWCIIGGESQPGCRPMDLVWAASLVGECRDAGVPVFVKQLGGHPDKRVKVEQWPEELRVQEFPGE